RKVPLVWTLHDMWPLTGHCAHSFDCDMWRTGCGPCPDLAIPPALLADGSFRNWSYKQQAYRGARIHLATPSKWLMERAALSILSESIIEQRVIPHGVDLEVFRPGSRMDSRHLLGVPADVTMLIFVAQAGAQNEFKDFSMVRAALERLTVG